MFMRANSSSCGRSQPAATSSIGRFDGIIQPIAAVMNDSVSRKWPGVKHWYVLGQQNRSSSISNSCRSVVPDRQ
jgi:hypothetical protein